MTKLHLAPNFSLPPEAVTETFLTLGQRGSGKTNTAAVIAEEMYAIGAPFVVLTPIDNWWGLKSSFDGKGAGLPIYIFGGQHADLPLAPTSGRLMADVLIEERISCVMCTHGFSGKERAAFTTDLAERLLDKNRQPLHVIVEEADAFIPQKPYPGEERMLGAMDRLIRWGRSPSAIGGTFISQRSAKINKDITTQCSVLVAHRTMAEQDIDAIKGWFKYHPNPDLQKKLLGEIASMPKGSAFFYSPAWLDYFGRVQVRRRNTFDSAATPKLGERVVTPKAATVDLNVLQKKMAETIEKTKAEDPRELRKQITDLQKKVKELEARKPEAAKVERVEVSVLTDADRALLTKFDSGIEYLDVLSRDIKAILAKISTRPSAPTLSKPSYKITETRQAPPQPNRTNGDAQLGNSGLRRILIALAQYPNGRSARQVGILAGLSSKSGSFNTYLSKGRSCGWIDGERGLMRITDLGLDALGAFDPLPRGPELLGYWISDLGQGGASRILQALAEQYPRSVSKEDLGKVTGLSHSSGSFNTYLSKLRTLELIEGRGELKASDTLFE